MNSPMSHDASWAWTGRRCATRWLRSAPFAASSYAVFDALMLAAAMRADCDVVWSEGMHDGMAINGRLRIGNPFRPE